MQTELVSITHKELHPSPLITLLSSHPSEECLSPSPQLTVQADLATLGEVPRVQSVQVSGFVHVPPVQAYIASILQVELQPSPFTVFLSSHCSLECLRPSPHCTVQESFPIFGDVPLVQRVQVSLVAGVPPVQACIASIWQTEFHPSPLTVL